MLEEHDLKFAHFADLIHAIASIPPRQRVSRNGAVSPELASLARWINALSRPLHERTGVIFFRFLFPDLDVRRRYGLQEALLIRSLAAALHLPPSAVTSLQTWAQTDSNNLDTGTGCLGRELYGHLQERTSVSETRLNRLSLAQVDDLLDELASKSGFSCSTLRLRSGSSRSTQTILASLFATMSPWEAACLTQIILRDLRPLLYAPPSASSSSTNLLKYRSNSYHHLELLPVMRLWDERMPGIYKLQANTDVAARTVHALQTRSESASKAGDAWDSNVQVALGVPVGIPKCSKGVSCVNALDFLEKADEVWAEVKYDGERMQIHVDMTLPTSSQIKIFSKSKKDSTMDRYATHQMIRAALSLPLVSNDNSNDTLLLIKRLSRLTQATKEPLRIKRAIIEAEMVAYSEEKEQIDGKCIDWSNRSSEVLTTFRTPIAEFWRIRSLVESTAKGGRAHLKRPGQAQDDDNTQCTILSDASADSDRHLGLVFFDILYLELSDATPAVTPRSIYSARRNTLESVILQIKGFISIAQRTLIRKHDRDTALGKLESVFAECVANYEEGLVLKGSNSQYNDWVIPWIKLKRDYIEGCGDCIDLVCIGAGWTKDRARELQVGPETFTDFYVGMIDSDQGVPTKPGARPKFVGVFPVSYGLEREQLHDLNLRTRATLDCQSTTERFTHALLPYTYELNPNTSRPSTLFGKPILMEVFGARFDKRPGSHHYELRFPRIAKVHRSEERSWLEGMTANEFHKTALASIGRDSSEKTLSSLVDRSWARSFVTSKMMPPPSPGIRDEKKRKRAAEEWETKFRQVDEHVLSNKRRKGDGGAYVIERSGGMFKLPVRETKLSPSQLITLSKSTDSAKTLPSPRLPQTRTNIAPEGSSQVLGRAVASATASPLEPEPSPNQIKKVRAVSFDDDTKGGPSLAESQEACRTRDALVCMPNARSGLQVDQGEQLNDMVVSPSPLDIHEQGPYQSQMSQHIAVASLSPTLPVVSSTPFPPLSVSEHAHAMRTDIPTPPSTLLPSTLTSSSTPVSSSAVDKAPLIAQQSFARINNSSASKQIASLPTPNPASRPKLRATLTTTRSLIPPLVLEPLLYERMLDAVILLSRRTPRPEACPKTNTLIPFERKVGTIDALLQCIGWLQPPGSTLSKPYFRGKAVAKGVAFLHADDMEDFEEAVMSVFQKQEMILSLGGIKKLHVYSLDQLYGSYSHRALVTCPSLRPLVVLPRSTPRNR